MVKIMAKNSADAPLIARKTGMAPTRCRQANTDHLLPRAARRRGPADRRLARQRAGRTIARARIPTRAIMRRAMRLSNATHRHTALGSRPGGVGDTPASWRRRRSPVGWGDQLGGA